MTYPTIEEVKQSEILDFIKSLVGGTEWSELGTDSLRNNEIGMALGMSLPFQGMEVIHDGFTARYLGMTDGWEEEDKIVDSFSSWAISKTK